MEEEVMEKVLSKLEQNQNNFEKLFAKLDEHDKEFEKINAKLDEHDKRFEEIDTNFKTVNAKLDEHDKEFKEIKNYLLVLEDKISTELPALFDGYSTNIEKSTEIEFKQKDLEKKVELDSLRISVLEDDSKHHTKQISKLLAK